ncbi:SDR family NAD(P)-dependent oxidoreductase [Microbacterium alcoholitolerans]|uniref:SDR family NAD(P)-dependent oxidoreductase n=1 Tax=unclassified Microbacterium TaxID=2609290 RepID=UPI003D1829C1
MSALAESGLLTGRVALITGAVGAIGHAIADRMASQGAAVVVADLDEAQASAVAAEIAARHGVRTMGIGVDVTEPTPLENVADRVEAELGVCDVIVANAGILVAKPALEIEQREWNTVISVNLTGAFHTATVFARRLERSGREGSVIFSSSLFGLRGGRGNAAYSASKFGLIGLAQSMAAELAPAGIRVNSVCPGQIGTAMLNQLFDRRAEQNGTTAEAERQQFVERIPMGRLGSAEDVADTFVYLASDLAAYVTGQSIVVDGGWQVG